RPGGQAFGSQPGEGASGEGEAARKRRRRRRSGRSREAALGTAAPPEEELEDGAPPSDYIALQVERGTPLVYREERALVPVEDEVEEVAPARPVRSRKINSGKLFWYVRTKSYVPIPELRRRFEVPADEMSAFQENGQRVYIGLPQDMADAVANLRRQNKIGLEVAPEFSASVVVGIYPIFRN